MAEIKPIEASDLNGVELDAQEIALDSLVGYVGFVRNLCTDLGTKNDSPEGYQDYLNFKSEIESAKISVFTPDSIDDDHTFDNLDLLGENDPIEEIPQTFYTFFNNMYLFANQINGGKGATPYDINPKSDYAPVVGPGLTPYDIMIHGQQDAVGQNLALA